MPQLLTLRRYERSEQGFTMVEMLVVILIIGVLTAIAVPLFLNHRQRAHDANTLTDARNSVNQIQNEFLKVLNNVDPSTWVEGYGASTSNEKTSFSIEVGTASMGGFSVPMARYVVEDAIQLSAGSRGSVGGVAEHFTVCFWNPHGKEFHNPDTAKVWDSRDGTFRSAQEDDDCVEVAHRHEGTEPTNPGGGDDNGDDGDGDGDGSGVTLPVTIEFGQPVPYHIMGNWADGVRFPVTVVTTEPELLKGIDQLPATLDGEPIQPVNIDGNTHGNLFMTDGWNKPGGLLEVKFGDQVLGSLDLSEYDFIGHAALDPSFVSTSRADLAAAVAWADARFPGAGVVAWAYNANIDFLHGNVDDYILFDDTIDWDGMPTLSGVESWNIYLDRVNGYAELKYWGGVDGSSIRIAHLIEKSDAPGYIPPDDGAAGDQEGPIPFDDGAPSLCASHEQAWLDFQQHIMDTYPDAINAMYSPGSLTVFGPGDSILYEGSYSGFASEVTWAYVLIDGNFVQEGMVEIGMAQCNT